MLLSWQPGNHQSTRLLGSCTLQLLGGLVLARACLVAGVGVRVNVGHPPSAARCPPGSCTFPPPCARLPPSSVLRAEVPAILTPPALHSAVALECECCGEVDRPAAASQSSPVAASQSSSGELQSTTSRQFDPQFLPTFPIPSHFWFGHDINSNSPFPMGHISV